jgi:hypothetical protein
MFSVGADQNRWGLLTMIVDRYELGWRNISERVKKPLTVVPGHPLEGREFDALNSAPGDALPDDLGLELPTRDFPLQAQIPDQAPHGVSPHPDPFRVRKCPTRKGQPEDFSPFSTAWAVFQLRAQSRDALPSSA